jgi:pantothenate kinase-related protein Tda10
VGCNGVSCVYMVPIDQARLGHSEKVRGEAGQGISWNFLVRWRLLPGTHMVLLGERSLWRGGFEEIRVCGDYEDK